MKRYIQFLTPGILFHCVFLLVVFLIPKEFNVYLNFIFYIGILLYLRHTQKINLSITEFKKNLDKGKMFLMPVCWTIIGFIISFAVTSFLELKFPFLEKGDIKLYAKTIPSLIVFGITTMALAPITEELLYRKKLILTTSKKSMYITSTISLLLYAFQHATSYFGIIIFVILGLPTTISYIVTKNIYIPLTAHLTVNILMNGITVITSLMTLLS